MEEHNKISINIYNYNVLSCLFIKLQFVKNQKEFTAKIEYITKLYNQEGKFLYSDLLRRDINQQSYMSIDRKSIHQTLTLFLPKGNFKISTKINDLNSSNTHTIEFSINLGKTDTVFS